MVHDPVDTNSRPDPTDQTPAGTPGRSRSTSSTRHPGERAKRHRGQKSDLRYQSRRRASITPGEASRKRSEEVADRLIRDKSGANVTGAQVIFKVITSRKPWEA